MEGRLAPPGQPQAGVGDGGGGFLFLVSLFSGRKSSLSADVAGRSPMSLKGSALTVGVFQ